VYFVRSWLCVGSSAYFRVSETDPGLNVLTHDPTRPTVERSETHYQFQIAVLILDDIILTTNKLLTKTKFQSSKTLFIANGTAINVRIGTKNPKWGETVDMTH